MILVTGATGFIGRAVVRALVGRGAAVRVLSRRPAGAADPPADPTIGASADPTIGAGVEAALGDLREPATLVPALAGVETVVHLGAALARGGTTVETMRAVNVDGTRALARAARAAGVARFIHGSSAGVYGDGRTAAPHAEDAPLAPATPYEVSKRDGEAALREALDGSSVRWTILRPCGVYGPGRHATLEFCREILARRLWIHGPAAVILHPTYVDDVVQSVLSSIDRSAAAGEVINVAGERPIRYPEFVGLFAAALGARPVQLAPPGALVRAAASPAAAVVRALGRSAPPALDRLSRRFVNRAAEIAKARRLLGFTPISLERGIGLTIAWARSQGLVGRRS